MTCLDFENRTQALLDRRQRELTDELSAHAAHCAACRELWQGLQHLHDAATGWPRPRLTAAIADEVLQRLRPEQITTATTLGIFLREATPVSRTLLANRRPGMAGFAALFSSALALVIAVGLGWRVSGHVSLAKRQAASPMTIAATPTNRSEATGSAERIRDRQLDVLLHDAREAYVALASQAWQQVSTVNVLLPPADAPTPFRGDETVPNVPETLSRPLAPIGHELREAVDSWLHQVFNSQDSST